MGKARSAQLRLRELDGVSRDVVLFCLGFTLLRFWAVLGRPPVRFNDSPSYFQIDFLGHATRLWTVPIFYNALPSDSVRVLAQIVLGVACWSALAFAVARSLRNALVARFGALLVLLLGLCIQVTEWDEAILSESLALSLTALLVATLLWLRLRRSTWAMVATLVVLVLWVFTRQLQAGVYVLVSLPLIAWILFRARRHMRSYMLIACALTALAVWSGYASDQARGIMRYNEYYLLTQRILLTPGGAEFFASRGMPDMPALVKAAATGQLVEHASAVRDPSWQAWNDRHWKQTYAEWLLRHPVADIRAPLVDVPNLLSGFPKYAASTRVALPSPVQDGLWERTSGDVPLWFALTLVVWLVSLRGSRPGRLRGNVPVSLDALGAGAVGFAALWYLAGWHLSSTELPRLSVEAAALLRIGLFLVLLAALDRIALCHLEVHHPRAGHRAS